MTAVPLMKTHCTDWFRGHCTILREHVLSMRTSYFDTDFALQMKLTKFPLIHTNITTFRNILFAESNPLVDVEALTDLLLDVLEINSNGRLQWYGAASERWTYTSSIYFSVTVITTIGKQKHKLLFKNFRL